MALTTRVGLSMSDNIDITSVGSATFAVSRVGGPSLPGKYSLQDGIVNFSPDAPLEPNTTYQVLVSGLQDLVGNRGGLFTSRFSTGDPAQLPTCTIRPSLPVEVGTSVRFEAESVTGPGPIRYTWYSGRSEHTPVASTSAVFSYPYSGRFGEVLTVQNDFGRTSCSLVQIVYDPVSAQPPTSSSSIIHDGMRSFNVNPDNNTVTAVDEDTMSKAWEVSVGRNPRTLAQSPDGSIWVVNQDDATVTILNGTDGTPRRLITLRYASRPYGIAFSPDGSAAYINLQATGQLVKIDPSGNFLGATDVGPHPRGVAITGNLRRILVTRFISPADHGEVYEVDAETFAKVRTFELAFDQGPDAEFSGRGVPNYIGSVRITPDDSRAFAPSKKDNIALGLFRDGQPLTFESAVLRCWNPPFG